ETSAGSKCTLLVARPHDVYAVGGRPEEVVADETAEDLIKVDMFIRQLIHPDERWITIVNRGTFEFAGMGLISVFNAGSSRPCQMQGVSNREHHARILFLM